MEIEGMLKKILRQDAQDKGRKFPSLLVSEEEKQMKKSTAFYIQDSSTPVQPGWVPNLQEEQQQPSCTLKFLTRDQTRMRSLT